MATKRRQIAFWGMVLLMAESGSGFCQTPAPTFMPEGLHKFDISGISPGMSLEQVRGLLQSQKQLDYREYKTTLRYNSPAGDKLVPASEFVAVADAANYVPGVPPNFVANGADIYIAHFTTPIAGSQHLYELTRYYSFPRGKEIHESTLVASLVKKYGNPTYQGDRQIGGGGNMLIWTSTPAPVSLQNDNRRGVCHPPPRAAISNVRAAPPVGVAMFSMSNALLTEAPCGDLILVQLEAQGGLGTSPDVTLIWAYTELLLGPNVVANGLIQADALAKSARAADEKASSQKAKQETAPSL